MKEWAKLWCFIVGIISFTIFVGSVFLFHIYIEYLNSYDIFLENSRYFLPVLSYIHYGFIVAYAIVIATNILMDMNNES